MITFSAFLDHVDRNDVERVIIRGTEIRGVTRATAPGGVCEFATVAPSNYPPMIDRLRAKNVTMQFEVYRETPFLTALITWAPVLFLFGLWRYFATRSQ